MFWSDRGTHTILATGWSSVKGLLLFSSYTGIVITSGKALSIHYETKAMCATQRETCRVTAAPSHGQFTHTQRCGMFANKLPRVPVYRAKGLCFQCLATAVLYFIRYP